VKDSIVKTSAGSLRYRIDGPANGLAVLLSNSLGTTLELWDGQTKAWSRANRVIRYDTRGHGGSSGPASEYTIDDLGRDALAVLDAAGAKTAHVCGLSLGGLVAMWLGVHAADRVNSLIVANTAARVGTVERWTERIEKLRNEGMVAIADMVMTTWFTEDFRRRQPDVVARFHRMVAACPPVGYIGCCAALRDADLREDVRRIRARTLVIAGEFDPTTPVANAEDTRARISGSTMVTLPCAHLSNVECADGFTRHAEEFFGSRQDSAHA
jgi:3-oxoadipate enol-lactonase